MHLVAVGPLARSAARRRRTARCPSTRGFEHAVHLRARARSSRRTPGGSAPGSSLALADSLGVGAGVGSGAGAGRRRGRGGGRPGCRPGVTESPSRAARWPGPPISATARITATAAARIPRPARPAPVVRGVVASAAPAAACPRRRRAAAGPDANSVSSGGSSRRAGRRRRRPSVLSRLGVAGRTVPLDRRAVGRRNRRPVGGGGRQVSALSRSRNSAAVGRSLRVVTPWPPAGCP